MGKRNKLQMLFEYISDGVGLVLSTGIAYVIIDSFIKDMPPYAIRDWKEYIVILFASYSIVFVGFTSSLNLEKQNRTREAISVIRNCTLTYLVLALLLLLIKNPIITSRLLYCVSFITFLCVSSIGRYILKRVLIKGFSRSKMATLVGVVTVSNRCDDFVAALSDDWSKSIKGIALLDSKYDNGHYIVRDEYKAVSSSHVRTSVQTIDSVASIPVCADEDTLIEWILSASLDEVYINMPYSFYDQDKVNDYIEQIEDMGITVHINLPVLENIVERSKFNNIKCDIAAGYPMASFSASIQNSTWAIIKRFFDIIGSIIGLIVSIPIILLTAIPLLIESPGGLFFKQQRIGLNGRIFDIYKLRSMYMDAESRKKELQCKNTIDGLMFKIDDDPRITKVGKFIRKTSIDELPQFFNVLKGDMSLVGTRPPTIDEFEQYQNHHKRRLSMRPGITGNWQVSGRSDIQNFEEVVKLDCEYIDNWSPLLDIKILLKTVGVVLFHKGAK